MVPVPYRTYRTTVTEKNAFLNFLCTVPYSRTVPGTVDNFSIENNLQGVNRVHQDLSTELKNKEWQESRLMDLRELTTKLCIVHTLETDREWK